jgi:hypothetical protein
MGMNREPTNYDPTLFWNNVMLEVHRRDFTAKKDGDAADQGPVMPEIGGPTRVSRAFAIVQIAMYQAFAGTYGGLSDYKPLADAGFGAPAKPNMNLYKPAVAGAAIAALTALYKDSRLRGYVTEQGRIYLSGLAKKHKVNDEDGKILSAADIRDGVAFGDRIGMAMVALREKDGSETDGWFEPGDAPLLHRRDPYSPSQGFLGARWGRVEPFGVTDTDHTKYLAPYPGHGSADARTNTRYLEDFEQVKMKGAGRILSSSTTVTAANRTPEETVIGVYWGYDGARGLGVPPRLYNQVVHAVVEAKPTDVSTNARLFALVNTAMADAAIIAWAAKYHYNLWRPVIGVREHDVGFGPSGGASGPSTTRKGDPFWAPLGAPQSNTLGIFNATPEFPAYPSGHATFGAAAFTAARLVYKEDVSFSFVSDELDGMTRDSDGSIRTRHERTLTLEEAIKENALSRVYLGVHWRFDGIGRENEKGELVGDEAKYGGVPAGKKIAAEICAAHFTPKKPKGK